jgi:hypothetical protein
METYIPSGTRSQEDLRGTAASLMLSEDDLSLITSGLVLLEQSESEMAKLARVERRDQNLADSLERWAKRTEELKNRVIDHQMSIVEKVIGD